MKYDATNQKRHAAAAVTVNIQGNVGFVLAELHDNKEATDFSEPRLGSQLHHEQLKPSESPDDSMDS
jgi:hypothetical protein